MKKKKVRVSLQTKIVGLIVSLLIFITVLLTGIFVYLEYQQTKESMGNQALQIATTVSLMPAIRNGMVDKDPELTIQPMVETIRKQVGAEFIVIGNDASIRYSHPDVEKIGKTMVGDDNDSALLFGEYYISEAVGTLGPSLRGKAPIYDDLGNITGIVSVGFLIEDIQAIVFDRIQKIAYFAFFVLGIGILGGVFLARNIRKDILGLEPHEIASLYRERNAILNSIKEGIIAIDDQGYITMLNPSAQNILGINEQSKHKKIDEILDNLEIYRVLETGVPEKNIEVLLRNRQVIVNRTPILENNRVIGVVSSFRDKTEVNEMLDTLSQVQKYSEDLRAQTHEYTNKLYVLSGLMQLGKYEEAIELIQIESSNHNMQNKILFEQIHDSKIQAILLGKVGKASEKKIQFTIDENSSINTLPKHINISQMITIVGNLIDNSFEAVEMKEKKVVTFFVTDMGKDIIIEVNDQGNGIPDKDIRKVFEFGYSTKSSSNRGYGLALVNQTVNELKGTIEIVSEKEKGTIFTVYLPKVIA
ncbi:ATP-binding protein [Litchfieldia salsa]|uniref:histidine kinase n=1 Tax=Litchfieldia salsa TaxID=930152 RepID=A0A1H0Q2P2_9BACI|nr:sensor histidine kinase [Litchfieldia salsa]SDP11687.1 two-component system, CitB family, sensor histidine kinase CitS [Litchfieldia salsa]